MLGLGLGLTSRAVQQGAGPVTIVSASFDGADNAAAIPNAETGHAWIYESGTWGIVGNQSYCSADGGANKNAAVVDAGVSDCTAKVTFTTYDTSASRLKFRSTGINNGFIADVNAGGFEVYKLEAGTYTQLGSTSASPARANGDVPEVVLLGASIILKANGADRVNTSSAFQQTATKHGIGAGAISTLARFNNFSVTVP